MQSIDIIFTNALVLTMDEAMNQYERGAVAVNGDSIVAVGLADDIENSFSAKETIDCQGKVLMPGLINAHTHIPMTLLRGIADDLRLDVWLQGYIFPTERKFVTPEFVRLGTLIGCAELIRSGCTTFNDMYFYEDAIAEATAEVGLRAVCGESILKFPTPDSSSYEDAMEQAREFIAKWKGHPLIVPAIAPHAPYTTTPEILRETAELAMEFDVPLHTHLAETTFEVDTLREIEGMPVIPYVRKHGLLEAKVIAAHCVHLDMGEIRTLQHAGAGVSHNPSSNLKLASGFAPIVKMLETGVNVGIGTDGAASNNDLDMFEEIRIAALIAKAVNNDPTALPASQALLMATRLGANALHIGDITGSITPNRRADLILVNLNPVHNSPAFRRSSENIYSQIVYAAKSTDVSDVMVNGKWLMRDRELLTVKEDELIVEAREVAKKIDEFLIEREESVLSKLIALGGSSEEESFEVQIKAKIAESNSIIDALMENDIDILYERHYRQHDAYFFFEDETQGILRYREDDFIDGAKNAPIKSRARLTLIGRKFEKEGDSKQLSRSRFLAPATNSLRFYREYFKPEKEVVIEKERLRWLVKYKETEFYLNLDNVTTPPLGHFLEIKSRTWSRKDADNKAQLLGELLELFGVNQDAVVTKDYIEIVEN
jgi:5-methylthioadenosine/S-adenosylhomocysteine deaminase